jgi:hypothetical protein
LDVSLRATSHLSDFLPEGGKISLNEGARVQDVFSRLGIDPDLVMLIVVNGRLGDVDSPLEHGALLELIPPISGG